MDVLTNFSFSNPTLCWLVFLFSCHAISQYVFSRVGPFKSDPALMAHQICSFVMVCFVGLNGTYYWITEAPYVKDRLYEITVGGPVVTHANLAFQTYDFVATLAIPVLCKPEMILHHTLAVLLAYFLLRDEYAHYYSIFFLGMTEVSAIPLCIVDVFKHFRGLAKKYDGFNTAVRMLFAGLFLLIRAVYWPFVSYRYFKDTYLSLQAGTCHSKPIAAFFGMSNILLTLLQWYWASLIVKALVKILSQPPAKQTTTNGNGAATTTKLVDAPISDVKAD